MIIETIIRYFILVLIVVSGICLSFYFYRKNEKETQKLQYGISGGILYTTYIIFSIMFNKLKNYDLSIESILNFITIILVLVILIAKIILKNEKIISKKTDIIMNFILPIILLIMFGIKMLVKS